MCTNNNGKKWERSLFAAVMFSTLMTTGCSMDFFNRADDVLTFVEVPCETLLEDRSLKDMESPAYWAQMMNCAKANSNKQMVSQWVGEREDTITWQASLRRAIMSDQLKISESERHKNIAQLKKSQAEMPEDVAGLVRLWIENQENQAIFTAEKNRYQRTNEALQLELKELNVKLKSLTDIERQLSRRKQ